MIGYDGMTKSAQFPGRFSPGRTGVLVGLVWILASLTPFLIVGESWGMIWIMMNCVVALPLQAVLGLAGVGNKAIVVIIATLANAALIGCIGSMIHIGLGKLIRRNADDER